MQGLEQFAYGYAGITNMDSVEKLWADLHTKLYGSGLVEHPGNNVYYAFVCRVALGKNKTVQRKKEIPFQDETTCNNLKDGYHSVECVVR